MKKVLFLISTIFLLAACSSDDEVLNENDVDKSTPEIILNEPTGGFEVDMMQWLRISVDVKNGEVASYKWTIDKQEIGNTNELLHLFAKAGTYEIEFSAKNDMGVSSKILNVTVNEQTYNNKIAKVYEFLPAPGQFVNTMPRATAQDDAETMLAKANEALTGGDMISLGGFEIGRASCRERV